MPNLYLSVNRWVALGLEATWGTSPASPTIYLQADPNPGTKPQVTYIENKAMYGSATDVIDVITGPIYTKFSTKGNLFPDTFPYLSFLLLGSEAVTGTAAPYTHTQSLLEAPTTGSQPGSVSVWDVDNVAYTAGSAKLIPGCVLDSLSVTLNPTSAANWSADFIGSELTSAPAPASAFTTSVMVPGYTTVLTIGGTAYDLAEEMTISAKRSAKQVPTLNGSPAPYIVWSSGLDVSGKFTVLANSADTLYFAALKREQLPVVAKVTENVSGDTFSWNLGTVQLKDPTVDSSKPYENITVSYQATANSTDATTGLSPLQFVYTNSTSTAIAL